MPVTSGMFLFEILVERVNSLVESRNLMIKSDFADIFSLELRDPKQMYIAMPEPLPPPPEPPGKKKKKPPKKKKGKKGQAPPPPPPEPVIQSGQSVLFGSTAEFLIENMNKFPLQVSLWSKEDNLTYIGSVQIPWDPSFLAFLERICHCEQPPAAVIRDDYNIFEEGVAKMMAKIGLQVKLTFLNNKITCAFRTLSEDINTNKFLYTGMNSKTTSFMCTMKTTRGQFVDNSNKVENKQIVLKPKEKSNNIAYANYKNAPGANLTSFQQEENTCCMNEAIKPPTSNNRAPDIAPTIDSIIDYVRKIIVSCNDQMRMLTPRPTITQKIEASDIEKRCYCKETSWPPEDFSERFRREAQSGPCPICTDAGKGSVGNHPVTFDIANIRGLCGKPECRLARYLRSYIQKLVDEDNEEFNLNDLIGPCGSEECTLAIKLKEFLRQEGAFAYDNDEVGRSAQCICIQKMEKELCRQESCASSCQHDCEIIGPKEDHCMQPSCPYDNPDIKRVYNVYYFTVEHDFDKSSSPKSNPSSPTSPKSNPTTSIGSAAPTWTTPTSADNSSEESKSGGNNKFPYCPPSCPSVKFSESASCSKAACACNLQRESFDTKCKSPVCDNLQTFPPSPADSNIVMKFKEIYNPCCIKSCDIAEKVKEFIDTNVARNETRLKCKELEDVDSCYCDCVCNFHFTSKTTYCAVCGGYECLGDDMKDLPAHAMPHPCPIYHKLYDKKYINVVSPWPDEPPSEEPKKEPPTKKLGSKPGLQRSEAAKSSASTKAKSSVYDKEEMQDKAKQAKQEKGRPSVDREEQGAPAVEKLSDLKNKYQYPLVPGEMGWNWKAEDVPALKFRPKWKPGAAHKVLVRKYRAVREGTDIIAKKKRAMMKGKKKLEMKPTLVVTKRDGEYTVQMEVFKKYSKERLLYQYPYDEKPPIIYTIGKTEAERKKIQAHRDRKARRETRRKCRLLQSTFRDKCQEICLKAYNQAIGLLPLPNPNSPECPCQSAAEGGPSPIIDSCSCSEEGSISSSDTDNDEWVIEFTPPMARWDVKVKHPPVLSDNETQYNYLDYKVKVLDKNGNQVPRFFKSHEGKTECSDLGGFWGPGKVWLEINKDGYIGPDERWIPMNFTGPDGLAYSAEEGFITDSSGQVLKLGVDGYIDKDLKWVWYSKKKPCKSPTEGAKNKADKGFSKVTESKTPGGRVACERGGDKGAGDKGAVKENDKKVVIAAGTRPATNRNRTQTVMNLSINREPRMNQRTQMSRWDKKSFEEYKKIAKYRQIMKQLEIYDDLGENLRPTKYNRASNYPSKKPSRIRQDTFKMTSSLLRMDGDTGSTSVKSSVPSPRRY